MSAIYSSGLLVVETANTLWPQRGQIPCRKERNQPGSNFRKPKARIGSVAIDFGMMCACSGIKGAVASPPQFSRNGHSTAYRQVIIAQQLAASCSRPATARAHSINVAVCLRNDDGAMSLLFRAAHRDHIL
jgi:hypothetical protein